MELDDSWDPDPLPNSRVRNHSQPRYKGQAARNSKMQSQYYQHSQTSYPQHSDRNAPISLEDESSDDENSSNEYPFLVQQPQVSHKRMKSPIQPVPDRRKRHQSEHPGGTGRGRKTNMEEAMHDHYPQVSQSCKKSLPRNDIRYQATENNHHNGYLDVENTLPKSRKSDPRRHSRAGDAYQDQVYMGEEDSGEKFIRESSFIAYQGNSFAKKRMKQGRNYNPVPPGTFTHEPTGQHHQQSTRANHEPVVTPKARQRLDYSRTQSVGPRISHDDGGNLHPGPENGISSARNRRKRQELQLASPIWRDRECAVQEPSSLHRQQGKNEKLTFADSIPHTPRNPSVRSRSVAPNGTQAVANQPREYNYGFIDDVDINETPLEEALQGRQNFQAKIQNTPTNLMKALPKSSAFRRSDSGAAEHIYQSPSRGSNGAVASSITIDLVTPERVVNARASMPFIPRHWTPARKGPIKVSNPRENFMQDGPGANGVETFAEDAQERQAVASSTSKVQRPEEITRQKKAAEKIVERERIADREALQRDLFGEVVSETEEEKRERDEATRLQAQRSREAKEKQEAIDANNDREKRQKNELKAQKEREKKDAEQREKNKDVALRKANRDADRHHQSLREAQDAEKRRKDANDKLQAKKKESAALKALEEQKQISDRERREHADKMNELERNIQKLNAQVTAQTAASLKPARKSAAENGATDTEDTSPLQAKLPTNMEVDVEDSLFLPETQITPVEASSDVKVTNQPRIPEAVNSDSNMVPSVEQDQSPASMAEIFAKTIPNTSGSNVEDREAEREAARKKRPGEHAATKRKREKSVAADPSPNTAACKAAPRTISKPPSKAAAKKNRTKSLAKSPGSSVFNIQLKPLHGPNDFVPREEPKGPNTVTEKDTIDPSVLKPRPFPFPPPPPKPTATSIRPETKFISQAELDEIEASRKKIRAETKARIDALKKKEFDAKKDENYQKKTVEYRKKKEKEFRDKARQDCKELGEFELQTMLDKLMEKRERDKNLRNIRRSGGKPPSEHENDAVSNSGLSNRLGTAVQVSSSDTASECNHVQEDDDPKAQALKEHEVRTAESLKALAESRAARRSQILPAKELGPLFSDSSSSESEEDPDDEETTQRYIENVRKNAAVTKAINTSNEVQSETSVVEEVDLEEDFEAAFEEELLIEKGIETAAAALNPDDHSGQVVEPMPDMTPYFEGSSSQRSSFTLAEQPTQLTIPSQISQPELDKPQNPPSYSMVNIYMVMTQLILHGHEDEAALKKKFFDVDKANRYAQTLVNEYRTIKYMQQEIVEKWDREYKYSCQIIHSGHKSTKVFVKAVPMNPKDIDKFDPRQINPRFANQYYMVRYEKIIERLDPETQKVCMTDRTIGILDDNKLYTALEMANHAAAEYLLENIKPKGEVEEHQNLYQEDIVPQARTGRDDCTREGLTFYCNLDNETIPWADFKSFEVKVESSRTEGPIN